MIALVITIIVLLILAGVSIAMLTRENGILTQAGNAKEETRGGSVKEAVDLWKINKNADNYTEDATAQTKEDLLNELEAQKLLIGNERSRLEAGEVITIGTKEISLEEEKTLAQQISAVNYGDYIDYNVDLEIGNVFNNELSNDYDWRIFYKDSSGNVFIIAEDYVPNSNTVLSGAMGKANMGTYTNYPYSAYWPNINNLTKNGSEDISSAVANKYMLSWLTANPASTNNNIKAVASLLDTNAWNGFATGVSGAEAVGGPTLEMYIASWNAKGYTPLYCNNSTGTGYYVGDTENPTTVYIGMSSDTNGYADTLYYPHTNSKDNCDGYWLASPSAAYPHIVMLVCCDSYVGYGGYYYDLYSTGRYYGVRPVVCLPSTVKGEKGTDGAWTKIQ